MNKATRSDILKRNLKFRSAAKVTVSQSLPCSASSTANLQQYQSHCQACLESVLPSQADVNRIWGKSAKLGYLLSQACLPISHD